jgi:Xaa-Pro aminopeptidase
MTDVKTIAAGWEPSRILALRDVMRTLKVDALVIPRWDEQQFEYVSLANERLAWTTGFTGSWGLSVVTHDDVVLFIDGRYPEQAARETDGDWVTLQHLYEEPPEAWLAQNVQAGWHVGFDSEVVTPDLYDRLLKVCEQNAAVMQPTGADPFDQCWSDRPDTPSSAVRQLSAEWAGESVAEKLARVREQMRVSDVAWLVETQPDNVNWLLNIRGQDLPYCPVVRARLLIGLEGEIHLFGDVTDSDSERLASSDAAVRCHARNQFLKTLERTIQPADRLWVDATQGPQCGRQMAEAAGGEALILRSPITDLKARKNETELSALRSACLSDSAVWVRLLHWLESAVHQESVTELAVEKRIHQFRTDVEDYTAPSFRTISAADGNASLAHYSAPADGGATLKSSTLFLLDSGGQFSRGGTTDTTRTWCFQKPTSERRRLATSVLKAHIAVAQQVFPVGALGHALDSAARLPMWQAQLDYDHGTGHGVGHYLSVHEFPQRMQKAGTAVGLQAGMTLTVEPGFYRADEFGIRHENLCEVVSHAEGWLGLESMAFVPFNRLLIDAGMLTPVERAWVDEYHQKVREKVGPVLGDEELIAWLEEATEPLSDE